MRSSPVACISTSTSSPSVELSRGVRPKRGVAFSIVFAALTPCEEVL